MKQKLVVVLTLCRQDSPLDFAPAIMQAKFAASMEYQAELIFTAKTVETLFPDVMESMMLGGENQISVYHLLSEAVKAGVRVKACIDMHQAQINDLIPEVTEAVGAAYIVTEAMDDETTVLTY